MKHDPKIAQLGLAIVAPSGYAKNEADWLDALGYLQTRVGTVHNHYDHARRQQRFADTDEARAAQIMQAARDPDVQIVMALRGGYGMSRLLPLLDFDALASSGKRFVGYSDFTALNLALLARTGTVSYAGPAATDFAQCVRSAYAEDHFWKAMLDRPEAIQLDPSPNGPLEAQGILWGGNLAMVTHLLGTPYFPAIEGGILFLEDVDEHPYRIERMLLQLHYAGVLERQQVVLLGDFSDYRLTPHDNGYDFATMLAFIRSRVAVPILTGLPFGHIRDRSTLPVGAMIDLQADATLSLQTSQNSSC